MTCRNCKLNHKGTDMAQIDIQAFSGIERLPLRARLSLLASMILGEGRAAARSAAAKGSERPDTAAKGKRLAGPVGRDVGYLRDLDIEIGF